MAGNDDLRRNAEGYVDPTAYAALKSIVDDEKTEKKAAYLVSVLKFIIRESGFELLNRIELKDKKSGRTFR